MAESFLSHRRLIITSDFHVWTTQIVIQEQIVVGFILKKYSKYSKMGFLDHIKRTKKCKYCTIIAVVYYIGVKDIANKKTKLCNIYF